LRRARSKRPFWRASSSPEQLKEPGREITMSQKPLKVFYVTDIHGSEIC
jgi:hypothetical protein